MEFERNPIAEIEEILDEMEDLIENSANVPLSKKKLIAEDELLRMIENVRSNLPTEIMQARQIVKDKREIVMLAKREADDILAKAEQQAQELVEKEAIVKRAKMIGQEIIAGAQRESREICKATGVYLDRLIMQTDDAICSSLNELRKAKRMLKIEGENTPVPLDEPAPATEEEE